MGYQDDLTAESIDGCLHELARILAIGLLRFRVAISDEKKHPDFAQDCLEVSDPTVLTVHSSKPSSRLPEGDQDVD